MSPRDLTHRRQQRPAFALLVVIVVVAVLTVMGTVVAVTLSGDNDQARIERVADVLHGLVAAADTANTTTGASFTGAVQKFPGTLSQLTHRISTADADCSAQSYTNTKVSAWLGPYYIVPIPTSGYRIGTGFFADNAIVKTLPVSTLDAAIQMQNVSLADAKALGLLLDQVSTGLGPIVTFASTDPTTVKYHFKYPNTVSC